MNWKKLTRDERIEILKDGIKRGLSGQQIADEVPGCTKGSIMGLSFKTGIKLPDKKRGPKSKKPVEAPKPSRKYRPVRPLPIVSAKKKLQKKAPKIELKPIWKTSSLMEREKVVRAGLAAGLSFRLISEKFADATPKAIKSFVERMRARDMFAPQAKQEAVRKAAPIAKPKPVKAAPVVTPKAAPTGGVNIMDIFSDGCRYPLWEDAPRRPLRSPDDWNFCGKPVRIGSSYCPACHDKVWVKPDRPQRYDRRYMGIGYAK